ncbi:MAG: MTAP family purine nucleoside phosphorylase [Phycisphaerae bacterium]|nr:MTAP family purine nucleoside phosphorylase [Phycisphaerae bacterium]
MGLRLACIGGEGAAALLEEGVFSARRLGPRNTPFGVSGPVYECNGSDGILFIPRNGETGYELCSAFVNYRANVYALKDLGAEAVVAWSAVRAISHNFRIGQFSIINDIIDETRQRQGTFFENRGVGTIRQWPVFCPTLRRTLEQILTERQAGFRNEAVYMCTEGPRRETPAELRKYVMVGAELVGNSVAPEVFLAKELQLCYAAITYITDYAEAGGDVRGYEPGGLFEALGMVTDEQRVSDAIEMLPAVLSGLAEKLADMPRDCACGASMEHHIARGEIGPDWRTWFQAEPKQP